MNFEKLIPDYLAGNLDGNTLKNFEKHMQENPEFNKEIEKLNIVWEKIGKLPEEKPSPQLKAKFYSMLDAYKPGMIKKESKPGFTEKFNDFIAGFWPKKPAVQFAFSFALLLIGLLIGNQSGLILNQRSQELTEMKVEMQQLQRLFMLSLMDKQSSSDRLKGVILANEIEQPDEKVIDVLFKTLDEDPNDNVRLASVDALTNYSDQENIRKRLISSFQKQNSPLVQVSMVNVFVRMEEKDVMESFKELLLKNNLNIFLEKELKWGIENLSNSKNLENKK